MSPEKKSCPTCSHTCEKRVMKLWNEKECPDWKPAEKTCENCGVNYKKCGFECDEACSDWKPKQPTGERTVLPRDEGLCPRVAAEKQGDMKAVFSVLEEFKETFKEIATTLEAFDKRIKRLEWPYPEAEIGKHD
ncbi:MAG: hypothetical protein V1909_00215 [Candidatus Micrarchaeota archaeon]